MEQASTLDKVRENLRLQQVYNIFVRYGLDIMFDRFPTVATLRHSMQRWVWNLPPDLERPSLPVKVRLMIEELGPTYVKVGQIVSSQASVIPPEWEEQLAQLQSDVPPFPGSQVREIIVDELGKPPEELFATFEPTPFAAASTAQVHRATLHDGTEAVVKVQRPDIRNQMRADVGIMRNASVDLQTGAITFIDTGMVGELELAQRLNIIQLILAVQQRDVAGMAAVMKNLSVPFVDKIDDKAYFKDFERTIGRVMIGGGAMDFGQAVSLAMNLLRDHGLRLDPNLTLAIKALMQAQAIAMLLFPGGGIVADGVQIIREEALKVVTADKIVDTAKKQWIAVAREAGNNLPSLADATSKWLSQYRKGRFEVYLDASGLGKEVNKVNHLGRQVVIALMLVGMIIGSAIATTGIALGGFQGDFWRLISQIAVLSYLFSSIVAAVIVLRLVWRWLRGKAPEQD